MSLESDLKSLRIQRDSLSDQIKELSKEFFRDKLKNVFIEYPKLKAFSFRQYTIYFNDGDELYFTVQTDSPDLQYGDEEEITEFHFSEYIYYPTKIKKELTPLDYERHEVQQRISKFLMNFDEDDFKQMFGDHVSVIVTPNGIKTEDYTDHD